MNDHIDLDLGPEEYERFNRAWIDTIGDQVENAVPPGASVLDLGCGRGELLERLVAAGYECVGVDGDESCVEMSSRLCPAFASTVEDAPEVLGDRRFDVVVMSHVLEHTVDPGAALIAAAALSRRYLIVAVPNLVATRSVADALKRRSGTVNRGHRQGWDRAHLDALLTRVGGLRILRFVPDRVEMPTRLGVVLARWGWADAIERRALTKLVPGLSLSLIAVTIVAETGEPSDGQSLGAR